MTSDPARPTLAYSPEDYAARERLERIIDLAGRFTYRRNMTERSEIRVLAEQVHALVFEGASVESVGGIDPWNDEEPRP